MERGIPGSAWEAWRDAGIEFARECHAKQVGIVPLGEQAAVYAASRGFGHQDVIRRAFVDGFLSWKGGDA